MIEGQNIEPAVNGLICRSALVTDDSSRKRKFQDDVAVVSENDASQNLRNEIEFSVDIETKIKEIKDNINGKSNRSKGKLEKLSETYKCKSENN